VTGDDLAHALFDHLQVLRGQGARQVEIVVKAVLHRRTDGVLGLREHLDHRLRHHMRSRVANAVQVAVFVSFFLCSTISPPFRTSISGPPEKVGAV
jgi:hypothetical protein